MTAIDALESLLAERWSCRGFLDQPVPRETIDRLLAVAQRTPSWCNTQPWQLTITSGEATVKLRKALLAGFDGSGTDFDFPSTYQGVFQERRRESGWQLYDAVGIEKGDREASTAQAAIAARAPFLREWFGLPDNRKIVCGISFGFADPPTPLGVTFGSPFSLKPDPNVTPTRCARGRSAQPSGGTSS